MARKNVLFIMCDQLRYDYLGCTGHPSIRTPNIDKLAKRGVNFVNSTCQSPVCGPSRMSVYTGRYMSSNGASQNWTPLRVGEKNIGDYLNPLGVRTVLVGKTHSVPDVQGLSHYGVEIDSELGVHHAHIGFEAFERDDGIHPDTMVKPNLAYNEYLKSRGYDEDDNPWHWAANSVETEDGKVRSGWFNDRANLPARVSDEESETPYMTRRAMEFLEQDDGETPWLLHLSYIKPHWPYIAPAPYNDMYSTDDLVPVNRSDEEREKANPLMRLEMEKVAGETFSSEEGRNRVLPTYMGLITQIDDQLGLLFDFMEARGLMEETLIVFTSDHGDYMGDHWMGDKGYFHHPSVRVPLIIVDPRPEADATRGSRDDAMVELVDLIPTFLDYFGGEQAPERLDGRSLQPRLHGQAVDWRTYTICEYDYAGQTYREETGRMPLDCRSYMVADDDWKYIHAPGFPPVLFDLVNDPEELIDLGLSDTHADQRQAMHNKLADWALQYRQRVTWTEERAQEMSGHEEDFGVIIGYWNEDSAIGRDRAVMPDRRPKKPR